MKHELLKLTREELIKKIIGYNANIGKQKQVIIDCKAHIMWLQSRLILAQRKIDFLENKKDTGRMNKREILNYSYIEHKINTFQRSRVRNQKLRKK